MANGRHCVIIGRQRFAIRHTLIQTGVELLAALRYGYGRIEKNSIL
jgi:hypothetical protein